MYQVYEQAGDRHYCLVNLGLLQVVDWPTGSGDEWVWATHLVMKHRLRPATGKSLFLNPPQPRLAGPWSGGPTSYSWTCKGPTGASFLFVSQLLLLGQAAFHQSRRLPAPSSAIHAEALLEESGAQGGLAGACAVEDAIVRTAARLTTTGHVGIFPDLSPFIISI